MTLFKILKFYNKHFKNLISKDTLKYCYFKKIEKLSKARYADNLEFIQWLKRFCQTKGETTDYDAVKRRGGADVDFSFAIKEVIPKIFNKASVFFINKKLEQQK